MASRSPSSSTKPPIRSTSSRELANCFPGDWKTERRRRIADDEPLTKAHHTKMEKLQAACQSLHDLQGDDQKVKTRWINEVEMYFRPFRLCVVHCAKDPIEVLECISDEDMEITWRFLTKLSKDRAPYWKRCEEVLRILMFSGKWMQRFRELNFSVEDLPPAVQGDFAGELKQIDGSAKSAFAYRLVCDNEARMAVVREDIAKHGCATIEESESAAVTVCFSCPSKMEQPAEGARCISACIPKSGACEALNLADFWPQFIAAKKLNLGEVQVIDAWCVASDPYDAPCVAFATLLLHFGGPVAEVEVSKAKAQFVCIITHSSGCSSILRMMPGVDGLDAPKTLSPFLMITSERGQIAFDAGKLLLELGSGVEKQADRRSCGGLRQACAAACAELPQRLNNPAKDFSRELVELLTSLRSFII